MKEGAGGCSANNAGAIAEGCSVKNAEAPPLLKNSDACTIIDKLTLHTKFMKLFLKTLLRVLVLAIFFFIAGFIYQSTRSATDIENHLPAGKLVAVNGYKMFVNCIGEGKPLIILEAGLGEGQLFWAHVHKALSSNTQVCAYDRLGKGWSQPTSKGQSSIDIVKTLHQLMTVLNLSPPYVLVGHSAGGLYVRKYAELYQEEVAGLALIDAAHEQTELHMPRQWVASRQSMESLMSLCGALQPTGIIRLLNIAESYASILNLPASKKEQYIAAFNQNHYCKSALLELQAYSNLSLTGQPPESLGDIPLVVISRGLGESDINQQGHFEKSLLIEVDQVWSRHQLELSKLSSQSRHIIAKNSGHFIPVDEPQVVIDAIETLIQQVRETLVMEVPN